MLSQIHERTTKTYVLAETLRAQRKANNEFCFFSSAALRAPRETLLIFVLRYWSEMLLRNQQRLFAVFSGVLKKFIHFGNIRFCHLLKVG